MIRIRRYDSSGSTVTTYDAVAEAEGVLKTLREGGGFVLDEGTEEVVHEGEELSEGHQYAYIPAIAGG